jgi:hypothetical protein
MDRLSDGNRKLIETILQHLDICIRLDAVATISPSNCDLLLKEIYRLKDREQELIFLKQERKEKRKVTLVMGDDWDGLYIDDVLVYENHSIPNMTLIEELGISYHVIYPDQEWLEENGRLPTHLHEVKEEE